MGIKLCANPSKKDGLNTRTVGIQPTKTAISKLLAVELTDDAGLPCACEKNTGSEMM